MSERAIVGTFFFHHSARHKQDFSLSPQELSELIRSHNKPQKADLQWIKLAGFGALESEKKSLRHDANVNWISGIEGDYDSEKSPLKISFDEAVQTLEDAGIECIVYTTPSHTPQSPHWRVLAPFAERYQPIERDRFMARLNGMFRGAFAPESFTLSQSYYIGYVSNGAGAGQHHQVEYIEGQAGRSDLARRDDLDAGAIGPKNKQKTASGDYEYVNFPELLNILTSGGDYHPVLPPIVGTIASRGAPKQLCIELMLGLFETALRKRPEIRERWKEVLEVVDWVYSKEQAKQQPQAETPPPSGWPWVWDKVDWDDYPPPPQEWSVRNRIPSKQVCLLSGHGATGKSTIGLYLACAHVMGRDWLKSLPKPGPAFFIDAEDDLNVIWRRLDAVREHYQIKFDDLFENGLQLLPMAGEDAVMATTNRDGKVIVTPFYRHVLERVEAHKPEQIVIASAANVFAGNENDRSQVQQFIGHLKKLAMISSGSVVLITHPSLTGLNTNTILSGSTQWHNAVRARMVLKGVDGNGSEKQDDSDLRQLEFAKNQYGKMDDSVLLRWTSGMFLPVPEQTNYEKAAAMAMAEDVFTTLLRRFIAAKRQVSPKPTARNNAAAVFAEQEEAIKAKLSKKELWAAMERLFKRNAIKVSEWGPPSQRMQYLEFP
jgi:RecA-family ATPase